MATPKKKWILEHGEGHWEVSLLDVTLTCDDNELDETVREVQMLAAA